MGIQITPNKSLKKLHTFAAQVQALAFCRVQSVNELQKALKLDRRPRFVLGGGSNVLFKENYNGLIIQNAIGGIKVLDQDSTSVLVEAGGGVIWHELVEWCLDQNYGGIENLSLIPGTVGAAPIQNIGAYGVEFESVFTGLDAVDTKTGEERSFLKSDCEFAYRQSVFKTSLKDAYVITRVRLKLSRDHHNMVLDYGDVYARLLESGISEPSVRDVSQTICAIRRSKLPDPSLVGNAGSFFKNPVVPATDFEKLQEDYPSIPGYKMGADHVKIPAAWLIEQCGWKGYRSGDVGIYPKHALVLVNYGSATGEQINALAAKVRTSVRETFAIELEAEVNIVSAGSPSESS